MTRRELHPVEASKRATDWPRALRLPEGRHTGEQSGGVGEIPVAWTVSERSIGVDSHGDCAATSGSLAL